MESPHDAFQVNNKKIIITGGEIHRFIGQETKSGAVLSGINDIATSGILEFRRYCAYAYIRLSWEVI